MLTRLWPGSAALLIVALLGAAPAHAQWSVSADASAATARYDGFLRSGVLLFTPVVRFERSLFTVAGRSTLSFFESGRSSLDALVAGSAFTPEYRSMRGELSGVGGLTRYGGLTTSYGGWGARLHVLTPRGGVWAGGGITSVTSATGVVDGSRGEAGAWFRAATLTLSAVGTASDVDGFDYLDAATSARWSRGWLELSANGAGRWSEEGERTRFAGDLSATAWLSRRLAVVVGHGSYLSDAVQLAPGGRYTAVTMRIASRPPALRDALARSIGYQAPTIVRPVTAGFEARPDRDGNVRIRVRAPDAGTIEIMGDFTDWEARPLARRRGDSWEITIPIARGTNRFNVRVNGGDWGVPPGVPVTDNDFGGVVGLLVIR